MATSLWLTMTLAVEPLANAANELALQEVQALVIMGDDQDVLLAPPLALGGFDIHRCGLHAPKGRWVTCWRDFHTCPPNEIFRCAAGKSKTDLSGFDNETDALGAIKHPSLLSICALARREQMFNRVSCVRELAISPVFEIFFIGFVSQSSL
jgi:hypothetical protein